MIAIDYSIFVQIGSFLVLWFLLSKLLFKPYLALLEAREKSTDGVKAETAALLKEGERLRAEYETTITRAREEGELAKKALQNEAVQARDRILAQARQEATAVVQAAHIEIERELQKGYQVAVEEAERIARQIAEKILGRTIQ
ncbi:MAG: ATP synthase F0 subunit B [Candidatus Binatia bacterium]